MSRSCCGANHIIVNGMLARRKPSVLLSEQRMSGLTFLVTLLDRLVIVKTVACLSKKSTWCHLDAFAVQLTNPRAA